MLVLAGQREASSERITSISGIKALALILIFGWHAGLLKAPDLGSRMCELFFVCSGILEALNHHGSYAYTLDEALSFFKRKLRSVYPAYIVSFFLASGLGALGLMKWTITGNTIAAVMNLLMMQPWFFNLRFSFNGVSWFIADLMLCYLITPMVSCCLMRRESSAKASVLRVYLLPIGALLFIRLLLQIAEFKGVVSINNHTFPLSRMLEYSMAFVVGSAIRAQGGAFRMAPSSLKGQAIDSILEVSSMSLYIIAIAALDGFWCVRPICVTLSILFVCSFVVSRGVVSKLLSIKPFEVFSTIQLPFYFFHQLIIIVVLKSFGLLFPNSWTRALIAFIATFMISFTWTQLEYRVQAGIKMGRKGLL